MKVDVSRTVQKTSAMLRENAPLILIVGGAAGELVGGAMACVATHRHLEWIIDRHRETLEMIHEAANAEKREVSGREVAGVYMTTAKVLARYYGPAVLVSGLSFASILSGNNMLRKRNLALAAAYATIDQSYKKYRGRVVERFGEQVDQELRHGIKQEKIEEKITDENGKTKKIKKTIDVICDDHLSDYARVFDKETAPMTYEEDHNYNRFFLTSQEALANNMLRAHGFLFLNDVYDMLGMKKTVAGQAVGWVYDKNDTSNDNYVDFCIREVYRRLSDDPNDVEKVFLLDFNVDGSILNHAKATKLIS